LAKAIRRRNVKNLLKKTFDFVQNNPKQSEYIAQAKFFTRKRSLSFPIVVSTILNLFKESVEYNISTLLPIFNQKPVTGAAFSIARYKINLSFFKDLNKILVKFHQKCPSKLWKGFQLIAGDGSSALLPASKQIKAFFGEYRCAANGVKTCMAQIFMFYDVFTDMVIDGRISKMEDGEKSLLKDCLADLPVTKAIFILDRGFGYFNICKLFLNQKKHFCIRVSVSNAAFGARAMENPSDDFVTDWEPSETERKTCRDHGLDCLPIKVRVSKIKLKTGEVEILVSSLYSMSAFTLSDMSELYHLRWGIEEGFKKLKPKMRLELFGSRKSDGIFQEFEAHLFMMNLVSIIGSAAQDEVQNKCSKRKLKYKYNWQNAYRYVRNKIVTLLNFMDVEHVLEELIALIAASTTAIKPEREFPRNEYKSKSRLYQTYK
jgi:hypothetical protein